MPNPITEAFDGLAKNDQNIVMSAFNACQTYLIKMKDGNMLGVFVANKSSYDIVFEKGHWSILKEKNNASGTA